MTFLDNKGGTIKENVGGRSDATRSVRLKREADEAGEYPHTPPGSHNDQLKPILDKEYRKGVHWLETLRLRRSKIVDGAFQVSQLTVQGFTRRNDNYHQSLELLVRDSVLKMKDVFEKYTADVMCVFLFLFLVSMIEFCSLGRQVPRFPT